MVSPCSLNVLFNKFYMYHIASASLDRSMVSFLAESLLGEAMHKSAKRIAYRTGNSMQSFWLGRADSENDA